jgi:thymidylate synthase (FAD)
VTKITVLDHGYVEHIESWGHGKSGKGYTMDGDLPEAERGIVEAARQSTQGAFRGWEQDSKLLKYLYENRHETPFEFAGMVIEVQAPIFVFREWHRHRTQSYNEMSARYASLPDLYYSPDPGSIELRLDQQKNKQSSSVGAVRPTPAEIDDWIEEVSQLYQQAEHAYQNALAEGIPKELARLVMPVGHYSRMRASANLRNWLAFLTLRTDPKAQWEIQQFAGAVAEIVKEQFPHTYALWAES